MISKHVMLILNVSLCKQKDAVGAILQSINSMKNIGTQEMSKNAQEEHVNYAQNNHREHGVMTASVIQFIKNDHLLVRVKPNAHVTKIDGFDEARRAVKISVNAPPEDGKANKELLRFLKKEGFRAEIVSGATSREKLLKIERFLK